jgi:hypothetical protein
MTECCIISWIIGSAILVTIICMHSSKITQELEKRGLE